MKKIRRLVYWLMVCSALLATVPPGQAVYPRLANYLSGLGCEETASPVEPGSGDHSFDDWDILIMIMDNQGYVPAANTMKLWRQNHSSLNIMAYVDPIEFNLNAVELETDAQGEINGLEHDLIQEIFLLYPGWWLLEPGSQLSASITATQTAIPVTDISQFTLYARNAGSEDNPDPMAPNYIQINQEHMLITGIDTGSGTLSVQRNLPGFPTATAHAAGSRVAAHVVYWEGTWMMNPTDKCTEIDGEKWNTFLAGWMADRLGNGTGSDIWTGIYLDCIWYDMSWLGTGPEYVDLDSDGVGESAATFNNDWHQGLRSLTQNINTSMPSNWKLMINGDVETETLNHAASVNGCLLEQFPYKWDWQEYMDAYFAWNTQSLQPGLQVIDCSVIDVSPSPKTDYQLMRFGLTSCLMGNGYYGYDDGDRGHNKRWWYDEYDNVGQGRGYLGNPVTSPVNQSQCLVREFENGLVICNPTDTDQVVSLNRQYWKIQGIQDPVHNSGEAVSSVTVPAEDGYILLKTGSSVEPLTLYMEMSETVFFPGDMFILWVEIGNLSAEAITFDEYILLDVFGDYWFWPRFLQLPEIDFETHTMQAGETLLEQDALHFDWPNVESTVSGLFFYGMLFEPGTFNPLSPLAMVEFGWDW